VSKNVFARAASALCLMLFLLATLPQPAHAYLDPGAGSMMLQIILGGLAGLAVGLRLFWHRMLGFFYRRPPTPPADANPAPDPGDAPRV
jgi:hypothetical protein